MNVQNRAAQTYALIGFPLRHSVSPFIHKKLCELKGFKADYVLYEVEEPALRTAYQNELCRLGGLNVTIPHKVAITELLDGLSPRAELFGAVNTVCFQNGRAIGHNTDCEGFLRSLKSAAIPLDGRVLITGCGGVSRMFAFESVLSGAAVTLAVRRSSLERARALQQELLRKTAKTVALTTLDEPGDGYDLLINGTPVGMFPHTHASPVPRGFAARCGAVFDAIYNPLETELLREARQAGAAALNGLPMLVWQAAVAEELWRGVRFDEDEVRRVIELTEKEL